jgi:fructan beta-fructosidase
MERTRWDVSAYQGQDAQIKLIDFSSGGWGHINFDDVRFE